MIHIIALMIALPVAIARGGRLANIASVRLRLGWLIFLAFAIQVAVVYLPQLQVKGQQELPAALILLSNLFLLGGVIVNRKISGMKLLGLGLLLNVIVMVANGGFMPIAPDVVAQLGLYSQVADAELGMRVVKSKDILLEPDQTLLWILSDIFVTGKYIPIKTVFSLGDAVGAIGLFWAIQRAMLPKRGSSAPTLPIGDRGTSGPPCLPIDSYLGGH